MKKILTAIIAVGITVRIIAKHVSQARLAPSTTQSMD